MHKHFIHVVVQWYYSCSRVLIVIALFTHCVWGATGSARCCQLYYHWDRNIFFCLKKVETFFCGCNPVNETRMLRSHWVIVILCDCDWLVAWCNVSSSPVLDWYICLLGNAFCTEVNAHPAFCFGKNEVHILQVLKFYYFQCRALDLSALKIYFKW